MRKILLFTDGSVHVQSKVGYGAYLSLFEDELPDSNLKQRVRTKRFENTSSTKLELQTLLWALSCVQSAGQKIIVYTDSQNISQLLDRRKRLEQNNFCSKSGKPLENGDLYKEFYLIIDSIDCEILKIQGHQQSRKKNNIEEIFTLVDRASRKALRNRNSDFLDL